MRGPIPPIEDGCIACERCFKFARRLANGVVEFYAHIDVQRWYTQYFRCWDSHVCPLQREIPFETAVTEGWLGINKR